MVNNSWDLFPLGIYDATLERKWQSALNSVASAGSTYKGFDQIGQPLQRVCSTWFLPSFIYIFARKKKLEIWLSPMRKAPTPKEKFIWTPLKLTCFRLCIVYLFRAESSECGSDFFIFFCICSNCVCLRRLSTVKLVRYVISFTSWRAPRCICLNKRKYFWPDISLNRDPVTKLDLITVFDVITLFREVSIGHLQRVRLANRGRLLLRTPGSAPFGTCICSNVETILSWTCHV